MAQQTGSDDLRTPSKLAYDQYITSSRWERRRAAYYANHERQCRACGTTERVELHHHTYKRMGEELDTDLVPLCKEHHDLVHAFHKSGRMSLTAATRKFLETYGTTLDVPRRPRPRSKPRRLPQGVPPPGFITPAQAAKILRVEVEDLPKPKQKKMRHKGFFREVTVKQWATVQPPRWLREARDRKQRGPRPEFRAVVYSGGGRPYSPEVQALFDAHSPIEQLQGEDRHIVSL